MAKRKRLDPAAFVGGDPARPEPVSPPPIAGVVREAAEASALAEMSDALISARQNGRMVIELPLHHIRLNHLVRDRLEMDPAEMSALMESLRARGQQTPIEVVALGENDYGLISGWRRCRALLRLSNETKSTPTVLALLRQPKEASDAYLAMVEENEIRVGLSYYERARIAMKSAEEGVFDTERAALSALFGTASKAKRSKIGTFMQIVRALDGHLRFPEAMGERAGLVLARALDDHPGLVRQVQAALQGAAPETAEAERRCLEGALSQFASPTPGKVSVPTDRPLRKDIADGVWCLENADGSVTLGGDRVTPKLRDALLRWLKDQT